MGNGIGNNDADPLDTSRLPANARLRSGTAARLAGLPVTTLRVWERRYGVVAAPKTDSGQRLYTPADVRRLALLRALSDRGHAIGTIATLPLDDLQGLAATMPVQSAAAPALSGLQLLAIGTGLAHKLRGVGLAPLQVFDDLAQAERALSVHVSPSETPVLVADLPSLQPAVAEQLLRLAAQWTSARLVLLYAYGAESLVESLRMAGVVVRRGPCSGRELLRLLTALQTGMQQAGAAAAASDQPPPRRFSDEALARVTEQASDVACECPRHVAEIVLLLVHFERYSADCGARSPDEMALHRHLGSLAGTARAMFEQALDRMAGRATSSVR